MPSDFDNSALTSVPTPGEDDALMFEVGGYTLGWRASGLALQRASDRGLEVGELLHELQTLFSADIGEEDLEEMSEEDIQEEIEMEGGVADFLSIVAKLIWTGALHFESDVDLDAIRAILDVEAVGDVPVDLMMSKIFPALEDEMGDEPGKKTQATSPR
jgi:hypothetical protein